MKVQRIVGNWGLGVGYWILAIGIWPLAIGFWLLPYLCVLLTGTYACAGGAGNIVRWELVGLYVQERFIAGAKVVIFSIRGLRFAVSDSLFSVLCFLVFVLWSLVFVPTSNAVRRYISVGIGPSAHTNAPIRGKSSVGMMSPHAPTSRQGRKLGRNVPPHTPSRRSRREPQRKEWDRREKITLSDEKTGSVNNEIVWVVCIFTMKNFYFCTPNIAIPKSKFEVCLRLK